MLFLTLRICIVGQEVRIPVKNSGDSGGGSENISGSLTGSHLGGATPYEPGTKFQSNVAGNITKKGLVAYWDFNEITGGVVKDQSGNGNDGTVSSSVVIDAGMKSNAVKFDGSTSSYITVPSRITVDGQNVTIMAWIKPASTKNNCIFNKERQITLCLMDGGITYADSVLWNYKEFGAHGEITIDTWQHVAVTLCGGIIKFFINGELVGTKERSAGDIEQNGKNLIIGKYSEKQDSGYIGLLDELYLYKRALTDDEIKVYYNSTKGTILPVTATYPSFTITTKTESPVIVNAARIAAERIRIRTGLVPTSAPGGLSIELDVRDKIGRERFQFETDRPGCIRVVGGDDRGVLYGVGDLLRTCNYAPGSITPYVRSGSPTGPALPLRGMYLASHFGNFWEIGRLDRVREEIEELALWGGNSLAVVYPVEQFTAVDGEESKRYIARLNALGAIAKLCGMDFGMIASMNVNVSGQTVPPGAAFTPIPGIWHGSVELCPSNPKGRSLMLRWQRQMLEAFDHLDFAITWPYDQGGCGCTNCMPWGGNGFLRASRDYAALVRERFPRCKVWLSTWWFDHHRDKGDYRGLFAAMEADGQQWFDGLLCGQDGLPTLSKRPAASRYPVAVFPEISMFDMTPWGGFGANPFPVELGHQLEQQQGVVGGWPYSEGIYEDINTILCLRHWWNPAGSVSNTLSAYANYHLGADPKGFCELALRLGKTHGRDGWNIRDLTGVDQAWTLAQSLDHSMPDWAKNGWRWRIVMIRSRIDALVQEKGVVRARDELRPLLDELARIYEVSPSSRQWVAQLPVPKPGNLAFAKAVTASSVLPGNLVSPGDLVNGLDQINSQNLDRWENDPGHGGQDWVMIDLGALHMVAEVRLQFSRNTQWGNVFGGIPSRLAISLSTDGTAFTPVVASDNVPREGAPYQARYWKYDCGKHPGRFVRIEFDASQSAGPTAGRLRLSEVEVYSPAFKKTPAKHDTRKILYNSTFIYSILHLFLPGFI